MSTSARHAEDAPIIAEIEKKNQALVEENAQLRQEQMRIHEQISGLKVERSGIIEDVVSIPLLYIITNRR